MICNRYREFIVNLSRLNKETFSRCKFSSRKMAFVRIREDKNRKSRGVTSVVKLISGRHTLIIESREESKLL